MVNKVLSEEEQAELKAIFDQRAKHFWTHIFEFDFPEAQIYLHSIGAFSKLAFTKEKQFEIIDKLTNEGIIKTDYIVDTVFINNYRSVAHPEQAPIKSDERYFWYRNTDWAREAFGPNEFTSMEEAGKKYGSALFINMTPEEMNYIETNYIADREIQLNFKATRNHGILLIKFGDEEWQEIYRERITAKTVKILRKAYINADNPVKTGIKYLEKRVFAKNPKVLALNPILIQLVDDTITFKKRVEVTPAQFESLKKALKIV